MYYGGKTAILNHLLEMVPVHEGYDEAFAGGATLLFAKNPAPHEAINDRLDIVVNFYQQLKLNFRKLKRLIDASVFSRSQLKRSNHIFMSHKAGLPVDKIELAWAFWYACSVGYSQKLFSSGLKFSFSGDCKPDVLQKKKRIFTDELAKRVEHLVIDNTDFRHFLKHRNFANHFHFQDPPYQGADQGHYSGWTENDLIDLLDWNVDCKGQFLLTDYPSPVLDAYIEKHGWFKKDITHRIKHPRGRKSITQVLVSNYSTQCGTLKLF